MLRTISRRRLELRSLYRIFPDGERMKCKKCGAEMKPMAIDTTGLRFCSAPPLMECDECEDRSCGIPPKRNHVYYKCLKCLNGAWT